MAPDNMKIHPLISDTKTLTALVDRLAKMPFVAVDTEFMRENSYWPELCLIQIASSDEAAAIDPMADGLDMKPLLDLLVENRRRAQDFPRRRAGSRNRPQSDRQDPGAVVRHPDRGHGAWAMASRSVIPT